MDAPTAVDIVGASKSPDLQDADQSEQERLVATGVALFTRITGYKLEDVTTSDEPLVFQTIKGLTEALAIDESEEGLENLSDFDLIKSFSAGPYSETRRDAQDAKQARLLHAWPWLNRMLWLLLTPDMADYWNAYFDGTVIPASSVTEVDWSGGDDYLYDEFGWMP